MAGRRFISPETLPEPFGYSQVVATSTTHLVYVSGQVPLDASGELVGDGDLATQTRQVFDNLSAALEAAGAGWRDVVKLNYYVRDISQIGTIRAVRDDYIDSERRPASTLVEVSGLFRDDVLIEIDAVAVRGD